jgi:hypothetical protein
MLPLLPKQKEKLQLPLPLLEELEKPPPLEGGLPLLGVKLNGDVENKRLPVKELPLLEGEPNRELPLLEQSEFVEGLVEFVELLGELENLDSVGLGVGLRGSSESLDSVGLNELSDVGVGVVEKLGVDVDAVGRLGVGVAAAVSLPRHL